MNIRRIIRQVINEQILLTEGDSRINAVNRLIDEKFSDLPLNSVVSSSDYYVNGNPNTTWKEYILFNLRHTFGLIGNSDVKYLLPVARLAYSDEVGFDRRNDNGVEVGMLIRIVQKMKKDDVLFKQIKSNPDTTYTELYDMFRKEFQEEDDADAESADKIEAGGSDYKIIEVNDFNTAKYYGDFSCSSSKLCYTQDEEVWDGYKGQEDQNRCYLCLRRGWEDIPEVANEGNPYDEYGTSMIFVFIGPDGNIQTSNCRWNHGNTGEYVSGTDHAFTKTMLAQTVGVPFSSVFKPYSDEQLHSRGYVTFNDAERMLEQGYRLEDIFDEANDCYDGLTRVKLHNKYNFVTFDEKLLSKQWFDFASCFNNGLSIVRNEGKFNFLETDGNILCDKWFDFVDWFSNGYANCVLDGVRYKIDLYGNIYSDVSESKYRYKNEVNRILELNNKLCNSFFLTESSKSHAAKRDAKIVIKNLLPDEALENEYVPKMFRELLHRTKGELTWLDFYERYIYENFFLTLSNKIDDSPVIRLEPAIARIAYGELNLALLLENLKQYDYSRPLRLLRGMLGVIYDNVQGIAEGDEKVNINFIDGNYDLSGKSFSELYSIIGEVASLRTGPSYGHLSDMNIDSSRYSLISLGRDYYGNQYISKVGDCTGINGNGALCYTQSSRTWDYYINNKGTNNSYILLRDDWDMLDGRNYLNDENPYDDYGLSIIWFFVNERGVMTTCNVRWNHEKPYPSNASCDMALTEADISHIMGKDFNTVFEKIGEDNIFDFLYKISNSTDIKEKTSLVNANMREMYSFDDGSKIYLFGNMSDDELQEDYINYDERGMFSVFGKLLWLDDEFDLKINSIINVFSQKGEGFNEIGIRRNTYYIINNNGDFIFDDSCRYVGNASDGYCLFQTQDKKYYYVDINGNILNDYGFDEAGEFKNGYAKVRVNGSVNIIDKNGNSMIDDIDGIVYIEFDDGFCFVQYKNGLYKMLDRNFTELNGDWIKNVIFTDQYGVAGVYVVKRGYSIVNRNGDYIVPFTDKYIEDYGDWGYKVYRKGSEDEFLLVYKGRVLINKWLTYCSGENNKGCREIRDSDYKFNMLRPDGTLASSDWFDIVNDRGFIDFDVPYLIKRQNGEYNLLSDSGKLLSPSWFEMKERFNNNGVAPIKDKQGDNIISKYGDKLLPKGCQNVRTLWGNYFEYTDVNGKRKRIIAPSF